MNNKRILILLFCLMVSVSLFALTRGPVNLSLAELFSDNNSQILHLRTTRIILALAASTFEA